MTDLGVTNFSSQGYDINNTGEIVGWMQSPTNFDQAGFVRIGNTLHDLNGMINVGEPAAVNEARFNNESGQILARNFASNNRWFVLTPTTLAATSLTLAATPGVYRGTTTLTATLTSASPSGANVQFRLNGVLLGTVQTNAQGVAQLTNVSLGTMNAGTHAAAASALFAGDATYLGATAAADVTIAKGVPLITWAQPAAITHPTALSSTQLNASANVSGQFSYSPAAGTVLQAGSGQTLQTTFTPIDTTNYEAATASVTINVLKRTPVVSWSNPAGIVYGTLLSATQLNATASVAGQFVYTPANGTKLDAGNNQVLSVAFTPNDTANYESVPATTVTINVSKATPTITWANPVAIVYGTALGTAQLNATANAAGTFSYSPASGTVLESGTRMLAVTFTPNDATNYASANASTTITVNKATATLSLGNLSHTYNGSAKSATVTSDPASLTGISVTYNGGSTAPVSAGSYTVVATLTSSNYDATPASGTLTIARAPATLTLGDLSQTHNGSPRAASVTSDPSGLSGISITYDGSPTAPSGAGSYAVAASLDNANYEATPATGTLTIGKASATITLANLSQGYNGSARTATASTNPIGLSSITLTYDGGAAAPVNAGSYTVRASLNNPNYSAPDAQGTLVISKASATLSLGGLSHTYNGSPKAATATSNPTGLTVVSLTYNGSGSAPTNAGSYAVQASLVNQNYEAQAVNGTMTIAKANQSITFAALADHTYGDAPFNVGATAGSGLAVSFSAAGACSLSGSTVTISSGGQCTITANQAGDDNYNPAAAVSHSFNTNYTWTDLLQPINTDGSSVFKLGSTVPVKFKLTGASAAVTNLQAKIYLAKVSNGVVGTELEAIATNNADGGNVFRFDPVEGQYIFNLGTKSLSQGTWQVRVDLLDGATHNTLISLRK
jgi:hypothetical protein